MPADLLGQVLGRFDGGDEVGEGRLQRRRGVTGIVGVVTGIIGIRPQWTVMDGDAWACIWWQIGKRYTVYIARIEV